MPTTTDFNEWLDSLHETDINEIYYLYQSINSNTEMGGYSCSSNEREQYFVTSFDNDNTLMLASDKAKQAFLKKLDHEYGGDFGWVGGAYEFARSMEKDD